MTTPRRHFTPEQKIAVLRRHLLEQVPVSQLCDELGIAPSLFYLWQRDLFENGHLLFTRNGRHADKAEAAKEQKIEALEAKLRRKDEVLGELMEEHVALKKSLGEL
jgi:transposase-like protein